MNPISIPLDPEFEAEKLDFYHRTQKVSQALYAQFQELQQAGAAQDLTFTNWTQTKTGRPNATERVEYLDPADLETYRLHNQDGLATLFAKDYKGEDTYNPLNCEKTVNGQERYALVIPAVEPVNIYVKTMNDHNVTSYYTHHTSLSLGEDVYFAGEATIKHGKFKSISNQSGHYKPNLRSFIYGLSVIQNQGFNLANCQAQVITSQHAFDQSETLYQNALEFITMYKDEGFASQTYQEQATSIDEAKDQFFKSGLARAVYYVLDAVNEVNDLYEFTIDDHDDTQIVAFKAKYDAKLKQNAPAPSAARTLFIEEEDPQVQTTDPLAGISRLLFRSYNSPEAATTNNFSYESPPATPTNAYDSPTNNKKPRWD